MRVHIELDEKALRGIVIAHIREELGPVGYKIAPEQVFIEVKSQQNFKSEWEQAAFRAKLDLDLTEGA